MAVATPIETSPRGRVAALRRQLETLAGALAARDVTAALACEADLGATLGPLAAPTIPAGDRAAVAADLAAAREALARCRALGTANHLLAEVTLEALGRVGAYGRDGASRARSPRGRDVVTRA